MVGHSQGQTQYPSHSLESHVGQLRRRSTGIGSRSMPVRVSRLSASYLLFYPCGTMGIAYKPDIYNTVYITRFSQPYDMEARKESGIQLQLFGSN